MLTCEQIKAARIFLGINQEELAEISGVSSGTIKVLETDQTALDNANQKTIRKIKTSLEERGIKFLAPKEDGSIAGIGLRYFPVDDKNKQT
jgi:transcriptional regulator with XRE-family HTH domain